MRALTTARLALEPVTVENAAALLRVMQAAHLREFQDVPRYTREEFERRVAQRPKRLHARAIGRFEWLIVPRGGSSPVGWVSLRLGDHAPGVAEIGYSLIYAHRRRGYAFEACVAVVGAAFGTSDIARVEACCVPENAPSRRLLERLGFAEIKQQRNGAVVRGRAVDIIVYQLAREDWAQAGSANSIATSATPKPK
jgi:ribosomal-protein-alanine N-acetyltransferase